ncbi:MAG TPA: RHS repeat-associated core domain-containing protein [Gemmatimonadales bacterium]|nr:RHS repeat-associated core domain-containing protein [Gemmatimonadales bacterium]
MTRRSYNALGLLAADSVTRDSIGAAHQLWYKFSGATYATAGDLLSYAEMVTHLSGGNTTWSNALTYSPDGQRRLIESLRTYGQVTRQYNWTYDVFGNRASQVQYLDDGSNPCQIPDTSYYGLDNRVTVGGKMVAGCTARSTSYLYDYAGNRVASQDTVQGEASPAGRAVQTYTAAGQLFFSLTPLPSGSPQNYAAGWNWYDVDGSRAISKNAFSATSYPVPDTSLAGPFTAYVYDGGQPVMLLQRNVSGTWVIADRMVVAGVDRPLAGLYNGQYLALVADRSGTVQAGVQPSGAADQLATYTDHGPFGNVENPTGASINTGGDVQAGFTGAGGTPNGLGLVYLRNRWYDPGTGRFLTQDPIGLAGGLNLYAYAGNNPTSFSDPFGMASDSVNFANPDAEKQYNQTFKSLAACAFGGKCKSSDEVAAAEAGLGALAAAEVSSKVITVQYGSVAGRQPATNAANGSGRTVTVDPNHPLMSPLSAGYGATLPEVIGHEVIESSLLIQSGNGETFGPSFAAAHQTAVAIGDDPILLGSGHSTRTSRSPIVNGVPDVFAYPLPFSQ